MMIIILILGVFFAVNMGGASFAASFATSCGSKILSEKKAGFLFFLFVVLGAVIFGKNVSQTLGTQLISPDILMPKAIVIIFFTASLSMFVANLMKIPQSTSFVTVGAIAGVGVYFQAINISVFYKMIPFWIVLPLMSFVLTFFLASYIYPPRRRNFWLYERFINHEKKLRIFVLVTSCYNAFSVGTNNVANVVGPLLQYGSFSLVTYLFVFSAFYGLGSLFFKGTLKAVSHQLVPLGLLTASIISFVSGSLMVVASVYGIPQSFVMLQMGAIFAISSLKQGKRTTFENPLTIKSFFTWIVNPILTFALSYVLCFLIS